MAFRRVASQYAPFQGTRILAEGYRICSFARSSNLLCDVAQVGNKVLNGASVRVRQAAKRGHPQTVESRHCPYNRLGSFLRALVDTFHHCSSICTRHVALSPEAIPASTRLECC